MSNGNGSYVTTSANMMKAFDKLPPTARAALANAAFNWVAQQPLTRWRNGVSGYQTGEQIAARVAEWDRNRIAKDRRRVWGIKDDDTVQPASLPKRKYRPRRRWWER